MPEPWFHIAQAERRRRLKKIAKSPGASSSPARIPAAPEMAAICTSMNGGSTS
jgi:hypothetical protein